MKSASAKNPAKLYKYFPRERLDFFSQLRLRFTPPAAFNDPFDMAPILDSMFAKPAEGGSFRELRHSLHKLGQRLADTYLNRARYPQKFMSDRYGVLSLTAQSDTLLMWAHYASDHKGFALEFSTKHPWFNQKIPAKDFGELGVLGRVTYSKDRPQFEIKRLELAAFLTKSEDWSYEQEWRMLLPLSEAGKVISATPYAVHLFDVPPKAISAVIFGAQMSKEDRVHVLKSLEAPALKHVVAKQAVLSSRHFSLELSPAEPLAVAPKRTGTKPTGSRKAKS
jgi:hypothetical protein